MRVCVVNASGSEILVSIGSSPVIVGSGAAADVRIDGKGLAPAHARFAEDTVEALSPCMVGDVALAAGAVRTLVPFVTLRLGSLLLYVDDDAYATSIPTREMALAALKDSASLWPSAVVVEGPGRGARLVLIDDRWHTIGRGDQADLQLDALSISRLHVELRRVGHAVRVRDRGATRGTFLGGDRLAPGREAIWTPHRMLRVGDAVLGLSIPGFREAPSLQPSSPIRAPALLLERSPSAEEPVPSSASSPVSAPTESVPSQRLIPNATQAGIAVMPAPVAVVATKAPAQRGDTVLRVTLVAIIFVSGAALVYLLLV